MAPQIWLFCLVILTALTSCTLANRIIEGREAHLGQFPFLVHIQTHTKCSGNIVSRNWVISAAHCTDSPYPCTLKAGIVDINDTGSNLQTRNAKRIINHPEYERGQTNFDISLIEVDEPFMWTEFVEPTPIEKEFREYKAGECIAAGFGTSDIWDDTQDGKLLYMFYQEDVNFCVRYGKEFVEVLEYKDHHLCSVFTGNVNIRPGDSGGPLLCNNKLAAVASDTFNSGTYFINKHTSVTYFNQWINDNTDVRTS